jgi:hypothetical protein
MPQLSEVFPTSEAAMKYEREIDALWYQGLVEAQECIKAAKAIIEAPVDWLLDPGPGPMLEWIADVLLERAALRIINALTEGEDEKTLNLRALRKHLLSRCRPELRDELAARVDRVFTACNMGDMKHRAERHRHGLLAHLGRTNFTEPVAFREALLSKRELEDLLEKAKTMLDALSVHAARSYDLHRRSSEDSMAFIVKTLMRTSMLLNMPEQQSPLLFNAFAEGFTREQRGTFALWREQCGLPPVEIPPSRGNGEAPAI